MLRQDFYSFQFLGEKSLQNKVEITEEFSGLRLDKFLALHFAAENYSRSYLQDLIKDGNVYVNEKAVKSSYKLEAGDLLSCSIPEAKLPEILAEDIPLDVVYEDEDVLLINKSAGMTVHPAPGLYSGTLVNAVLAYAGDSLSGINGVMRPGIVHRLDKDTSGLIILAKNDMAHQSLAEQLQERTLERKYLCIVSENVKEDQFTVNKPIGRHSSHRVKMAVIEDDRQKSRDARTHFTVLARAQFKQKSFAVLEAKLDTGRTHQIRVHLSYKKRAIVGDSLYGGDCSIFNINRQALHAYKITFIHPRTLEQMSFQIPLAADIQKILDTIGVELSL